LDLSENRDHSIEQCGCSALAKRVAKIKPKLFCFGHIHNSRNGIINAGVTRLSTHRTLYSNGSIVTDGKYGKISSNGNIIEYK
jgi:Icc-related predicted phosphoesterase